LPIDHNLATPSLEIRSLGVDGYRAPIDRPVRTAFGTMTDRPAVIVRVKSSDGLEGYGEIWCNFPTIGAEHRALLVTSYLATEIVGRTWDSPAAAFDHLTARSHILSLQTGEPGPLAQAIAGIDIAMWDLAARKAEQPLWRLLGGVDARQVPTYASGIGPDGVSDLALAARLAGHRAFKLKVGFGRNRDLENVAELRAALGDGVSLAVDANQAWSLDEAVEMAEALARYNLIWLEEPLAVDSPLEDWEQLRESSPIPLAGGENLRGQAQFDATMAVFDVVQPDIAKWGGISAGLPLARRIMGAGNRYCPHYLGGGVGLLASAHLLAAAGGDGLLEVDCNPNPLREGLAQPYPELRDGVFELTDAPGLGIAPGGATEFVTLSETVEA